MKKTLSLFGLGIVLLFCFQLLFFQLPLRLKIERGDVEVYQEPPNILKIPSLTSLHIEGGNVEIRYDSSGRLEENSSYKMEIKDGKMYVQLLPDTTADYSNLSNIPQLTIYVSRVDSVLANQSSTSILIPPTFAQARLFAKQQGDDAELSFDVNKDCSDIVDAYGETQWQSDSCLNRNKINLHLDIEMEGGSLDFKDLEFRSARLKLRHSFLRLTASDYTESITIDRDRHTEVYLPYSKLDRMKITTSKD